MSLRPSELRPLCVHVDQNPWRFPPKTLSPIAFLTSVSDGCVWFGIPGGSLRRFCLPALPDVCVQRVRIVHGSCVPALLSLVHLHPALGSLHAPDVAPNPICRPSRTLSSFAGQAGHTPLCVLGVTWRRLSCFPVSGDVGDLESQTIPIGLWPYPPRPWTWLLGLGMRVSAVNT